MVEEIDQGSRASTARRTSRLRREDAGFTYVPAQALLEARPRARRTSMSARTRRSAASSTMDARHGRRSRSCADMSSHILSRVIDVREVRRHLRRRAEERGHGRPHARDRPRRSPRSRAADHAVGVPLEGAGGGGVDGQYARHVVDLHRRARVRMAADGRAGVAAIEQRNIEKATLLYDYLDATEFYANRRPARGSLADERAVQAPGRRRSTRRSSKARRKPAWCS